MCSIGIWKMFIEDSVCFYSSGTSKLLKGISDDRWALHPDSSPYYPTFHLQKPQGLQKAMSTCLHIVFNH